MALKQSYLKDRGGKLLILALLAVSAHIIWTTVVQPGAEAWI